MKRIALFSFALAALLGVSSQAETKSDYDHHYKLDAAKTWNFKAHENSVKDSIGNNSLWEQRIRQDITQQLATAGFTQPKSDGPELLVRYRIGTKKRVETQYLRSGYPGYFGYYGRRGRWFGWQPGWGQTTVWRTPYLKSTLSMDVVDARTNQLIWRGYDTEAIDFNKSDKTINKAVEHLTKRLEHDLKVK